jgi:hypothetical protein
MTQRGDSFLWKEVFDIADTLTENGPEFLSDLQTELLQFNAEVRLLVADHLQRSNYKRNGHNGDGEEMVSVQN